MPTDSNIKYGFDAVKDMVLGRRNNAFESIKSVYYTLNSSAILLWERPASKLYEVTDVTNPIIEFMPIEDIELRNFSVLVDSKSTYGQWHAEIIHESGLCIYRNNGNTGDKEGTVPGIEGFVFTEDVTAQTPNGKPVLLKAENRYYFLLTDDFYTSNAHHYFKHANVEKGNYRLLDSQMNIQFMEEDISNRNYIGYINNETELKSYKFGKSDFFNYMGATAYSQLFSCNLTNGFAHYFNPNIPASLGVLELDELPTSGVEKYTIAISKFHKQDWWSDDLFAAYYDPDKSGGAGPDQHWFTSMYEIPGGSVFSTFSGDSSSNKMSTLTLYRDKKFFLRINGVNV